MAFPYVELPRGLTGAIGVKDYGQLPRVLGDELQLVTESMELFLFNRRENVTGTGAALTVGTQTFTLSLVPAGEAWYLWAAQVTAATGVGEAAAIAPQLRIGGANIAVGPYQSCAASTILNASINSWPCRWLAPGEGLAISCLTVTGAPTTSFQMVVTRVRI